MTDRLPRQLPHSAEAERTILGAILVDPQSITSLAGFDARDLYGEAHRRILAAFERVLAQTGDVDVVALKDDLMRRNELEAVGGAAYLAGLMDGVPRGAGNLSQWARIVQRHALSRRIIHAANRTAQEALEGEAEPSEILDHAFAALLELSRRSSADAFLDNITTARRLVIAERGGFVRASDELFA